MAEIKVPELAESITEGTIAQWLKQPGDYVEKGEYIVELETDKVNVEVISEEAGTIQELKAEEGDTVEVGQVIAVVGEGGEAPAPSEEKAEEKAEAPEQKDQKQEPAKEEPAATEKKNRPIASPAARKLAREKGIDLSDVPTDPLGRVRKQDIEAYGNKPASAPAKPAPEAKKAPKSDNGKPVEREKMSRRRQTIAKRLVEVQQTAAMLTTFNEIDMTAVMELRKRKKDKFFEDHDVRLGFMSFFTKAVVAALKKYPYVNAEIDGDEIVLKKFYDVGVAVSTEDGLVVPVVRDCERKNFAEIEGEIMELATKARKNKLALADLQGGSFTITNGGVFGSLLSTPILNGPQVGILGMHKIQLRPMAIDKDTMENRPMMYVALSYDHRIIDGKEAVGFLAMVKELLENPEDLLLEG
ncbi:2-oxoglutarate dehydrogenase complex dihydrolipoyllysine-residue succinyltransferase [Rossellomorea marisflavi]|uniref:Dihydrolipoyllysine-residue succinyltransferase component of 2-oxoglutarate dehydrogenase complex n=1 Tax=Rossellomorea marisflavi TaxID=189381 RepID=A0A5D4S2D4_9BACI|nr:2-oxoglutarate dehydrogenase complex dihydrolipoyllysine-residue succinyltransferase [Rossellomorea marisflavi]KQU59948.1 dihydrolipoamide succinyltransferase [Bacillus sp. Leaf406]VXB78452.1 2-oxoglutarate dehydrogenase complex (dihydrolipoamide transsuccinylase, E2 subunit) [Bacillus sp. 349Y]MDW4526958.1 2-oxoglutarate dehydrogenase complex dihydrolipoyllysine-residue succinyltransferase [Rossellomorea marisflavi]TYS56264.1 2-oxoglutarate dehydrogenase complex dihydrolipoyllysine-residue 